ncbi:MAG TPA: type III pantothenate kinase [Polyangiaceae bacterium]|jgi:type III pantothenate kinase|nr:type III pantothenate kinase [Polyangiaceae bacterium]
MLLAVDVGNTNVSFGVLENGKLVHHMRSESARQRTSDEYAIVVRQMMQLYDIAPASIDAAIVASVVPALTDTMVGFIKRAFGIEPIVVGPGVKTGMPILYEDPREVGADRIVNAVAGYEWAKGSVIVVDFGTATTFDCVSKKGEYMGGVIVPGVQISADALFARAARLHRVDFAVPPRAIGKNPTQSMQSGIVYGYAALVDGLCDRLKKEMGDSPRVIATGGLASLICKETKHVELVDHDLTLTGLWLIHKRNAA